jgi:hypothetical protein
MITSTTGAAKAKHLPLYSSFHDIIVESVSQWSLAE